MYAQLIYMLSAHECLLFSGFYLILIFTSLCFFSLSTTLLVLIGGLLYYGFQLTNWISNLTSKEPIVLYDWLDEIAHRKVISLVDSKLELNKVAHCGQEISLENEAFQISENLCKDYIVPWCTTISPESAFPSDAERAIFELIHSIVRKLSTIDVIEFSKDILCWFQLISSPSTRDKLLLGDDDMNIFLESCSEKVLKYCSSSVCALIDDKDKSEKFSDPLLLMIKDLLTKAAIIPIFDLISDPDFLNQCIARMFGMKFREFILYGPDGGHDFLPNPTESMMISPLKTLLNGTMRSISINITNNTNLTTDIETNPSWESAIQRVKLHKRSLSQPGDIVSSKKISATDMIDSQRITDSLSCEAGIDMDSSPHPSSKVFRNIRINKWELVKSAKEMYIVYIISFDALFEEIHPEKMYSSSGENEDETREECIVSSLIWKNLLIKHRFREFVDLQVKLENNARLRGTLRGMNKTVIKPSTLKLTMLNFMSLNPLRSNVSNKSVIEHRRRCLEKYLNELSKFEKISKSREFRDFLGYKEERSSFLRSPNQSILIPLNIDKVYRNVRDAITFLKPSNPQEGAFAPGPSLVISDSPLTCLKITKLPHNKRSNMLKVLKEPRFMSNLIQSIETKKETNSGETSPEICFLHLVNKKSQGDDELDGPSIDCHRKNNRVKVPLVESLIEIVQTVIPTTPWLSLTLIAIKIYLGTILERIVSTLIVRICCTETFVYLLHLLHESLWEDEDKNEWIKEEVSSVSHLINKLAVKLHDKPLINYLPIRFLEQSIQPFFNTFQSKDHNKMFLILILSSLLKRSQIA